MPARSSRNTTSEAPASEPPSAKGRKTRTRLLAAAKVVFARDGFLNTRVSDIAEEAGMAHGSFYHYFDSKESIFREVVELQEQALLTYRIAEGEPAGPLSVYDRIWRANRSYLAWYRKEARIMGVIEEVSRYDREVNRVRAERQRRFAAWYQASIERLQEQGDVDARVDARFAASALGAMLARVAELWLVQGYDEYTMDQAVNQATLLWANALGIEVPPDALERSTSRPKA